jgi:hypothetical protein
MPDQQPPSWREIASDIVVAVAAVCVVVMGLIALGVPLGAGS